MGRKKESILTDFLSLEISFTRDGQIQQKVIKFSANGYHRNSLPFLVASGSESLANELMELDVVGNLPPPILP